MAEDRLHGSKWEANILRYSPDERRQSADGTPEGTETAASPDSPRCTWWPRHPAPKRRNARPQRSHELGDARADGGSLRPRAICLQKGPKAPSTGAQRMGLGLRCPFCAPLLRLVSSVAIGVSSAARKCPRLSASHLRPVSICAICVPSAARAKRRSSRPSAARECLRHLRPISGPVRVWHIYVGPAPHSAPAIGRPPSTSRSGRWN
jgi:hypothetical protein